MDGARNRSVDVSWDLDCFRLSNFCINCDKYPANNCVVFYDSEVISVFNFIVGYLRVMRVVRRRRMLNNFAVFA